MDIYEVAFGGESRSLWFWYAFAREKASKGVGYVNIARWSWNCACAHVHVIICHWLSIWERKREWLKQNRSRRTEEWPHGIEMLICTI